MTLRIVLTAGEEPQLSDQHECLAFEDALLGWQVPPTAETLAMLQRRRWVNDGVTRQFVVHSQNRAALQMFVERFAVAIEADDLVFIQALKKHITQNPVLPADMEHYDCVVAFIRKKRSP